MKTQVTLINTSSEFPERPTLDQAQQIAKILGTDPQEVEKGDVFFLMTLPPLLESILNNMGFLQMTFLVDNSSVEIELEAEA